jgi:hypothetical protein
MCIDAQAKHGYCLLRISIINRCFVTCDCAAFWALTLALALALVLALALALALVCARCSRTICSLFVTLLSLMTSSTTAAMILEQRRRQAWRSPPSFCCMSAAMKNARTRERARASTTAAKTITDRLPIACTPCS